MRTPEDIETDPDGLIRLGTVVSVDFTGARCTVSCEDGVRTPPLRWLETRMGKTRCWSPPSPGEQVIIFCQAGEIGAGLILRGIASTAFPPPSGQDKLDLIRFDDGAILSYDTAAHRLDVTLPSSATLAVTAPGGMTISGDLSITGDVSMSGDVSVTGDVAVSKTLSAQTDVIGGGKSLKSHTHIGVSAGGAQSGPPA